MTNSASSNLPQVAVLLSGREQFSSHFGGAIARWTYEVYSRLKDRATVTVFGFPSDQSTSYALPHQTSSAWRVCNVLQKIPLARRYEESFWVRSLIGRLRNFAMIHIHNRPQWPAMLRKLDFAGTIVLHLHNDHLGHWSPPELDALASQVDAVAVCSAYLRSTFAAKSGALSTKTHVIFNGADVQLFSPREEIREPKTIFFVGRLDKEKGVLQLLQAYQRVIEIHPDAKLVVAGSTGFGKHAETAYVRDLRKFAERLRDQKHADIQFTGYLDHDKDLPRWFQRATLFACPSLFQEPFGLVNAEAMACATSVVGSNRGGIPEVVGNTGRLVDPENVNAFAAAIANLLSDPAECMRLGHAASQRCRELFDWKVTAGNWMGLIDSVIDGTRHKMARES